MSSPEIDIIQRPFDRKHTKEWIGSLDQNYIFFQMYIQEKYKNIVYCSPYSRIALDFRPKINRGEMVFIFRENNPFWVERSKDSEKFIVKGSIKDYNRYKKIISKTSKRFLLFHVSTYDAYGIHAISVLYDKITNELELFQRNPGKEKYIPYEGSKPLLLFFFRDVFGKKVKPVYNNNLCIKAWEISNLCSSMHFEFYRKLSGDCMIWALWYLELRLKNKDIPRRQVLERTMRIFTKDLKTYMSDVNLACRVILGYRKFIDDFTDQFIVAKTSDEIPIKINKRKSTPLLTKAGRLMKTYLFLLGKNLKIIRSSA
jgi:hypothetical protein